MIEQVWMFHLEIHLCEFAIRIFIQKIFLFYKAKLNFIIKGSFLMLFYLCHYPVFSKTSELDYFYKLMIQSVFKLFIN